MFSMKKQEPESTLIGKRRGIEREYECNLGDLGKMRLIL
jgi:hypothetical protein